MRFAYKLSTWIGSADDFVDAGLIEALVAVVTLKDLQMRSDNTLAAKLLALLHVDGPGSKGRLKPLFINGPTLAFGKRLLEVRQLGERLHHAKARLLKLGPGGIEIEAAFEMVHSRLEKRFAVQQAPQADGAEICLPRKRRMGEIFGDLGR